MEKIIAGRKVLIFIMRQGFVPNAVMIGLMIDIGRKVMLMVKVDVIPLSELEDYFIFERLKTELVLKLESIKELSERKLKLVNDLIPLCTKLGMLKDKHRIKLDSDLAKVIRQQRRLG